jgi:hypothetical protein
MFIHPSIYPAICGTNGEGVHTTGISGYVGPCLKNKFSPNMNWINMDKYN